MANNPRKWPCFDCREPKTATRPGSRCPACSKAHDTARNRARMDRLKRDADAMDKIRERARRRMAAKRLAAKRAPVLMREADPSVLLYRAEKAKAEARNAALIEAAKSIIERAA